MRGSGRADRIHFTGAWLGGAKLSLSRRGSPELAFTLESIEGSLASILHIATLANILQSTTVSGIPVNNSCSAHHAFATASARCLRTPAASAVRAAASSTQGSGDSCGWSILSHGDGEPHIGQVLVYTLKRPMHEPI